MKKPWFEPHLTSLLSDRIDTLNNWRSQVPTLSGQTKNFETWLLVELVDRVSRSDNIRDLRTNGNLVGKKIRASEVFGLSGSKAKAVHLSPDISVRLKINNSVISAEIKTGLAPNEILNDLKIVQHYKKIGICNQAEFAWVVLLPNGDSESRSSTKSFEKIFQRIQDDNPALSFFRNAITPWMSLVVAVTPE